MKRWKNLYQAAKTFLDFASWAWMDNNDLFGVRNPKGGEIR